ncbi:integrase catalytic domain-containing protein [Trichonephila clavipes]|uniref:Integrase catalytic domain-containing protein n=1 Tax=Trichonephila clavipes TaxID=2585209 RepID=A0A8X6RIA7_TRICX|nr:integrase catalytic domain-containing protein [Trichonephila clavipes]
MDLERLKEKRKILRMSVTKHLTKMEFTLSKEISAEFNKEAKLEELLSLKSQLTEKLNELIKAAENIQLQIKIGEMAADISSCEEYKDRGKEDEVNCKDIIANHLIVKKEEFDFDRVRNSWSLETMEINPDNEVSVSDKEILKSLEQNTVYMNKRYKTRLLWQEDSRELKSSYEIAEFEISKTFEKNEELYLKYDEIIKEHLRDGIIERVNMNLDKNINTEYFLPHHAVVREQKDSTKVRTVFDASSKGKGALSLNDCLESGPNLNPNLIKIILRFILRKIAFCADIQRSFLEIGTVEEDRHF